MRYERYSEALNQFVRERADCPLSGVEGCQDYP